MCSELKTWEAGHAAIKSKLNWGKTKVKGYTAALLLNKRSNSRGSFEGFRVTPLEQVTGNYRRYPMQQDNIKQK